MAQITVQINVRAPISKVWECYNKPEHISGWAFATDEWEAPSAENNLHKGGKFKTRMQAKDGSGGFDFEGTYSNVIEHKLIEYDMSDGRHVKTEFAQTKEGVKIITAFDPEKENPPEMQRSGWQAILNYFKKYVESK